MEKNERRRLILLAGILIIVITVIGILIQTTYITKDQPKAEKGILDLSNWDFDTDGMVRLDGEWEIYWGEILDTQEIRDRILGGETPNYYQVPGDWKAHGKQFGAATYRLTVKFPEDTSIIGIKTSVIRMSNHIHVNGLDVGYSGNPSETKSDYWVDNVPYVTSFSMDGNSAEILVQVADYDYKSGGIVQSIYLGKPSDLNSLNNFNCITTSFVAAGLLVGGLFYLLIYFGKRREKGILYYSIHIMMIAFFVMIYGDKILLQTFPGLPFVLMLKLECFCLYWSCVFMCLLVYEFTGRRLHRWWIRAVVVVVGGYGTLYVLLPLAVISSVENIFLLLCLLLYAFNIVYLIILIVKNRCGNLSRENAILLAAAFLSVLVFLPNGILFVNNMTSSNYVGTLGYLFYVGIMSTLISRQYNEAYRTIEHMNSQLLELDRLKDDFLSTTSYELKLPLAGIRNIIENTISQKGLTVTQTKDLELVALACRRLGNLVDDIQDLTSMKQGIVKLQPKNVVARDVVNVVIQMLQAASGPSRVRLLNSIPKDLPKVYVDEERLRQIYYNVLGILYEKMRAGVIEAGGAFRDGQVIFWVEARGKGAGIILEEFRQTFFQEQKPDSADASVSMGLSIVKNLLEIQEGRIWNVGIGQKERAVTFSLPLEQESLVEEESLPSEDIYQIEQQIEAKEKYRILIADDDATSLREMELVLEQETYSIVPVHNGQEALDQLEGEEQFDLVILDVMMPMVSGFQVLESIRHRYSTIELPVLLITSRNRSEDIRLGFVGGANDYVFKPFEAEELRARVGTILQLKSTISTLVSTELMFLQAQIKPHFLYNALSVISSLSTRNPQKAKELLLDLADYLHGSFQFENKDGMVSLETEIKTVRAYLSIEQARFRERLQVVYENDHLGGGLVPILTIQPLVENAVRHGILSKLEGGTLWIRIKSHPKELEIIIEDNGIGMDQETIDSILSGKRSRGVGLMNIQKRLLSLYGQGLEIHSQLGEYTRVTIRIPFERGTFT